MMNSFSSTFDRSVWRLLAAVLIPLLFLPFYLAPVWDIDFWWHLAMGRSILSLGTIPEFDPLGVYGSFDLRASTIQNGYWITQVAYHYVFSNLGANGIIWLRAALLAGAVSVALIGTLRAKTGWGAILFASVCMASTMESYSADRPATVSYLLFSIFLLLLKPESGRTEVWRIFALGLNLVLWANMHGSVALPALILVMLATANVVLRSIPNHKAGRESWRSSLFQSLILLGLAGLSLLSPNHIDLYRSMVGFEGSELQARTSEYMTPWAVTSQLGIMLSGYWALLLVSPLAAWGLIIQRRHSDLLILGLLLLMSLTAYRYVPYFLLGGGPLIALGLHTAVDRGAEKLRAIAPWLLVAAALTVLSISYPAFEKERFGISETRFPVQATTFLQQDLAGERHVIFNHYNWGGFLLYQLAGTHQIFIDGRNFENERFAAYTQILWATPIGQRMLDDWRFSVVVVPEYAMGGERYAIVPYLNAHPEWILAYRDKTAFVFKRSRPPLTTPVPARPDA